MPDQNSAIMLLFTLTNAAAQYLINQARIYSPWYSGGIALHPRLSTALHVVFGFIVAEIRQGIGAGNNAGGHCQRQKPESNFFHSVTLQEEPSETVTVLPKLCTLTSGGQFAPTVLP